MADSEIRFLGDLQRLERKPGDVFVLMCEHALICADGCVLCRASKAQALADTRARAARYAQQVRPQPGEPEHERDRARANV